MGYNYPKEIAIYFRDSGLIKGSMPASKFMVLAILGGAFISLGGLLTVVVAGGIPGIGAENSGLIKFVAGALFPVGLIMVAVSGADLFTSDCTAMTLPYLQKQISIKTLIKVWVLSYLLNFVGTQLIAYVFVAETGLLYGDSLEYLYNYTDKKMNQDFLSVFIKGVGANWLVCLGMWQGYAAKDVVGKCIGIWIPVMIFVTLGFEHSIANMFFIPTAIYMGSSITWGEFIINNLIPATIGNIIGGVVFVACAYWFVYMRENKPQSEK